ncbi:mini-chromosome maintenance complex-binding protein [Phoenix dactylifera]|uniref:Mini-chromosome maintenance complex-binding protein n=1 Tax=Phoenix dactylifera TaxID=42345 RepID=A0A8B7BPC9_PHODC|nr:mini-chromosome maintenance complex-binding protein [Phoenix dactylifera]
MVGLPYDFLANPLGAVRLSFEKAVAEAPPNVDPPAAFRGKDWGVLDLFRDFLFEQGGLSQVPVLDASTIRWIQPNTLVRVRGMVQDMLGNEFYIGAYKDGSIWRTNKFTDSALFPMPPAYETQLWERHLFHCVPIPGQNSWTMELSPSPTVRNMLGCCTSQHGEKRRREEDADGMDLNCSDHGDQTSPSSSKKQKEDEYLCHPSHSSAELVNHGCSLQQSNVANFDASSLSCLVKVYDMPESHIKLNDVFEFIGIYTFDPDPVVHNDDSDDLMDDLMEDVMVHLPPSKVPRVHCLICRKLAVQDFLSNFHVIEPLPSIVKGIRESLLGHLSMALGNDGLAAQCVLLHLLSRLRARVDVVTVGKLSLNLTSFTRESASVFGNQLTAAIQMLLPFTHAIPLTVEYLNTATLKPRKNNQTGRLVAGVLQLAEGTHLTIDETHMQAGVLDSNGVENARLLKHLMEWQTVEYDFEYYKLEMAADVQLLILSEGKSNILPADLVLPFRPTAVAAAVNPSAEELQAWRWYLATLKSLPHSSEPEMHQLLQDELVAAMRGDRSLGCTDLNRLLTMAQLMSSSFGEKTLSLERWQMVKELERLRKERLK